MIHQSPPTACRYCSARGFGVPTFKDLGSLRAHINEVHPGERGAEEWLRSLQGGEYPEDLAWVERVPPEVEKELKPISKALLQALREEFHKEGVD